MTDDNVVVYNFPALEKAITNFNTSSGKIANIAGRLKTNAEAIQRAAKSPASDTYYGNVCDLSGSVSEAAKLLKGHVSKLQGHLESAQAAESSAESVAEGVPTFKMQ